MLGFLFGSACLVGLAALLARPAWHGGRCGHHGRGGRWSGPAWMLRRLYERLDTTPGQEKVIRRAVDDLTAEAETLRDEAGRTREDMARAVSGAAFDESALRDAFARHDERLARLREQLVASLGQVHEALDDRQRRELASLVSEGLGWAGSWRGPYRDAPRPT